MRPTLTTILLVLAATVAADKDGFNIFKDYLRTGKELEGFMEGEVSPKFLYFYRAAPSLLLPETSGSKRNQFWRSVGRKELDELAPQESHGAPRDMAFFRPIAARTFVAKRDVSSSEQQRSKEMAKKALFSWTVEPRRVAADGDLRIKAAVGNY